jgi:carotenoid cleavage dioxygenase
MPASAPSTSPTVDTHAYLRGVFAPVMEEITEPELRVVGELPRDLVGMFVRNGSNPRYAPRGRYHWFDGDGMVHGVHFADGKASYRNRFVRTAGFLAEEAARGALYTGIMEPPDRGRPGGPFKDTANTDLVFHDGRLLALWWLGGRCHVLGLPDLETRGTHDYGGRLRRGLAAHPKVDPATGELVFFDYQMRPPYLTYGVISGGGELVHQVPVDLPGPRLLHDMAITERYSVLCDFPLQWDPELLARGKTRVVFRRDQPARFGVLPRLGDGASVRWFEAAPCYMYHTINAWEDGDEIVLVGCRIEDPLPERPNPSRPLPRLDLLELEPYLHRWRLHLGTGAVREERLDDVPTEFPRMDNRRLGRPSRYAYNPRIARRHELLFDGVVKYDTERGASTTFGWGEGRYGGETVFAPRVGSAGEDDGYLVTFVHDAVSDRSELVVLDARRVEDGPVARCLVPQRVPIGYHAWWVSAEDLGRQRPA